jgi:hypothetical protein
MTTIDELERMSVHSAKPIDKEDKPLVQWDLNANRKHGFRIVIVFNSVFINEFYREWTQSEFFAFLDGYYPSEIRIKLTKDDISGEYYLVQVPYREEPNL